MVAMGKMAMVMMVLKEVNSLMRSSQSLERCSGPNVAHKSVPLVMEHVVLQTVHQVEHVDLRTVHQVEHVVLRTVHHMEERCTHLLNPQVKTPTTSIK